MSLVLQGNYEESEALLQENRDLLDRTAEALLERETLDTADLRALMDGQTLPPLPAPDAESEVTDSESPTDPTPTRSSLGKSSPTRNRCRAREAPVEEPRTDEIFSADRVTIVRVLNHTPDSFSDGGRFGTPRGGPPDIALRLPQAWPWKRPVPT